MELLVRCVSANRTELLYSRANADDAGIDLYVQEDVTIQPGTAVLVGMGIQCCMHVNDWPVAFDLRSRSSIYKTPLILANGVGTIDAGYRGEIKAALRNLGSEPYLLERGTRIVQIVAPSLMTVKTITDVDEFPVMTARGEGGFGSSGV